MPPQPFFALRPSIIIVCGVVIRIITCIYTHKTGRRRFVFGRPLSPDASAEKNFFDGRPALIYALLRPIVILFIIIIIVYNLVVFISTTPVGTRHIPLVRRPYRVLYYVYCILCVVEGGSLKLFCPKY